MPAPIRIASLSIMLTLATGMTTHVRAQPTPLGPNPLPTNTPIPFDDMTPPCTPELRNNPYITCREKDSTITKPAVQRPNTLIPTPDHSWKLLVQTYNGTVSLIKDLTQADCEKARAKLFRTLPAPVGPSSNQVTSADTLPKMADCFQ